MFTSLSANVGFNPLLAGALAGGALPEQCLPQQEEVEAGDWGPIHRGRGKTPSPQPSVAWPKANGNGFFRGALQTFISTVEMILLLTQMFGKCLSVLWCNMLTQEKKG